MSTTTEQAPEAPPIHLNAKQQSRIQKRRLARQQLITHLALVRKNNKTHNASSQHPEHPTRDVGCMHRPQGPDDRFLTPEQITTQELERLTIHETKATVIESLDEKPKL
jgi:hypothetical protein